MNAYSQLKIGIPYFSERMNHLDIHSVSEYVIFDDLLRPLIKFDSNGEIAADLAESWEIKDNYKKFIIKIKANQRFSDNSVITVNDVVNSLNRIVKNPNIIHGDGNKIKKISILSDTHLEIDLFDTNPFFLTELSTPEYRIVKIESSMYDVTSGPYFINSTNNSRISLSLNKNYPFNTNVKFKRIEYIPYKTFSEKELNNLDIVWPTSTATMTEIQSFEKKGFYIHRFNLGFSYWLSINPNTLSKNERIQIKHLLDSTLKDSTFFANNNLTRSKQLFLPYGPGRLNDKEIELVNSEMKHEQNYNLKKVKLLLPKSIQSELLATFNKVFFNKEVTLYSSFSEYAQLTKKNQYDIALVNNDLSSIDLRSSLIVTFNASRPLVWIEKGNKDYTLLLNSISTELQSVKRYPMIKDLGKKMLEDVLVYPLYYDYGFVLAKKNIDFSQLNQTAAETLSWKIK